MPRPGGAANKYGHYYEVSWTVLQLIEILKDEAEGIHIEPSNIEKAEFILFRGGYRELHQAKRSHTLGKWTLNKLIGNGILRAMFNQLKDPCSCFVFVSGSDAPELRELTERAREAENLEVFQQGYLEADKQKRAYEKVKKSWNNPEDSKVYDILKRIKIETIDDGNIQHRVLDSLSVFFSSESNRVYGKLKDIVEFSIGKIITHDILIALLEQDGFSLRPLINPRVAPGLIKKATEKYLESTETRLIQRALIPRSITKEILNKLENSQHSCNIILTGKAGAGKTACMVAVVKELQEKMPTLALRLDRLYTNPQTTIDIGKELGFEESPALVLKAATDKSGGTEAALIIDQLDAVSTTSGRNFHFIEVVEKTLNEIQRIQGRLKIHVVFACREFDWQNDHRLRRMHSLPDLSKKEVEEFSIDEVIGILFKRGVRMEKLSPHQVEVLQLPQNLSLFLSLDIERVKVPEFDTENKLYRLFWKEKRRSIAERSNPSYDNQWLNVIKFLCEEMSETKKLFVLSEKLDKFSPDYIDQMVSEGVLSFDGKHYGFMHESFYDYCMARVFVTEDKSLLSHLLQTEQHLFHRAQTRQVLTYLRTQDKQRYCKELDELLRSPKIRFHIKDLALALAVSFSVLDEQDERVLWPWLESNLNAIKKTGKPSEDKLTKLVWHHFFTSKSWFSSMDKQGHVESWLASDNERLINMAINYVRYHLFHSGKRVAALIKPYMGRSDLWTSRLCPVMSRADYRENRELFDLLLCLIDEGIMDREMYPLHISKRSHSAFYPENVKWAKTHPEWFSELAAHYLRRWLTLFHQSGRKQFTIVPWESTTLSKLCIDLNGFYEILDLAPKAYVRHVFPIVLEITDLLINPGLSTLPQRGPIYYNYPRSLIDIFVQGTLRAFKNIAQIEPGEMNDCVVKLRQCKTYAANFMLLGLYTYKASCCSEEAVDLLCRETWRFDCGYKDSLYWTSRELVQAITPYCSGGSRERLESAILNYLPAREQSSRRTEYAGHASFTLISAIDPLYLSEYAKARKKELKKKFIKPDGPPQLSIKAEFIGSPIDDTSARGMNDEQWLQAIAKYNQESYREPLQGGATELAGQLQEFLVSDPERFANLCLQFPPKTNPVYIKHILLGLRHAKISNELKFQVCHKAYREAPEECGQEIALLLGEIKETLPEDIIEMLTWVASKCLDPEKELWNERSQSGDYYYGGDILTYGINTARGNAAMAIGHLISYDEEYIRHFDSAIQYLINDKSLAVRSCAAFTLHAIAMYDMPLALSLFTTLVSVDQRLLGTSYVYEFLRDGIACKCYPKLHDHVEKMLRSDEPRIGKNGAVLVSMAALYGEATDHLVDEAIAGTPSQQYGVAVVASRCIAHGMHKAWCEKRLLPLLESEDRQVRREAASFFTSLKDKPLEDYQVFLQKFYDTPAYHDSASLFFRMLEASSERLPGIVCTACEKFLDQSKDKVGITGAGNHAFFVTDLIFRTYYQHQNDEWASPCLNLIDQMFEYSPGSIRDKLSEYER